MRWYRPDSGKILIMLSGCLFLFAMVLGIDGSSAIAKTSPLALAPTATAVSADLVTQAEAVEQVFINIYQRMDPAVVNIEISNQESGDVVASGSGFVIDTNGDIVTNNHVVDGAKSITVTFYDGYTAPAKIVGTDAYSDLAVIKVNVSADHLTPLTLGDSST